MGRAYRVREFAELAGVTVRALYHYDRIGLLKPRRSSAGYRLYALTDLERLEQIVSLRFIGLSLKQIKAALEANSLDLPHALRLQRKTLEEKRELLERAIAVVEEVEHSTETGERPEASALKKIINALKRPAFADQIKTKLQAQVQLETQTQWKALFLEVESSLHEDPASEQAQALARRWVLLVEASTGGDLAVRAKAIKDWADHRNWPAEGRSALVARFGLDANAGDAENIHRIENVSKFIGRAVGRAIGNFRELALTTPAGLKSKQRENPSDAWIELFHQVESSLAEDPASVQAQALVKRWQELASRSTSQEESRSAPKLSILSPGKLAPQSSYAVTPERQAIFVNQLARLYRIEQVAAFIKRAAGLPTKQE